MSAVLSKNVLERAGWTLAETALALGVTTLSGVSTWWAAPLALFLSALKTSVVDKLAAPKPEEAGP